MTAGPTGDSSPRSGASVCSLPSPTYREIAELWESHGVRPTRAKVRLAVKRTGNCYGITSNAKPYRAPRVGDRVSECGMLGEHGTIVALKRPWKGCEPQATIYTDSGRRVYLFQTALIGYTIEC